MVVVLVGCATAAAGPIAFVALMAGPIAARLLGPAGGLLAAGFVGACIVLGADLIANHVMPKPVPTGVVTGVVGAVFLLWLLVTANREGTGAMNEHELRAERPVAGLRRGDRSSTT